MNQASETDVLGLQAEKQHLTIEQVQTLPELLAMRVRCTPSGEAYRAFDESTTCLEKPELGRNSRTCCLWSRAVCLESSCRRKGGNLAAQWL
jgi:long-chain acyl-CoA synthetase